MSTELTEQIDTLWITSFIWTQKERNVQAFLPVRPFNLPFKSETKPSTSRKIHVCFAWIDAPFHTFLSKDLVTLLPKITKFKFLNGYAIIFCIKS